MGKKAWAVIALMAALFATPMNAGERRGADVRIYFEIGGQVRGELLAVGGSSLTVRASSGRETSYDVGEITRVVLEKKAKKVPWGFIGFAAGAGAGYAIGANPHNWPHSDDTRILNGIGKGLLWGAAGALVGTMIAGAWNRDGETIVLFEGLNDEQLRANLARLRRSARVRD